ncbi:MAG: glutathione S-transferase [Linnemannia gamsii]|nr:MAG: glutathione S-transferase [Linnemannia gamsii]
MTVPKITIYSNIACPYANRVLIALQETKQEHELAFVDLKTPRPESYLKEINAYGEVPALKTADGNVVLESLIIAEYLADLNPEAGLLSNDPLQRAQSRYLIQHWTSRTQPAIAKASLALDSPTEEAKALDLAEAELEKVDALLSNVNITQAGPYFLGAQFSYADLALAPFLARGYLVTAFHEESVQKAFDERLKANKNLQRFLAWREAVVERPSVQKSLPSKEVVLDAYRTKFLKNRL